MTFIRPKQGRPKTEDRVGRDRSQGKKEEGKECKEVKKR